MAGTSQWTHCTTDGTLTGKAFSADGLGGCYQKNPQSAAPAFFGYMGCALALILSNVGAAYGTAKSGIGLGAMGPMSPQLVMKCMIPIIMAGVLGIYGLIVAVLIQSKIKPPLKVDKWNAALGPDGGLNQYGWSSGFSHLAAGLSCGLSCLAAGYAIGLAGEAGVKAVGQEAKLFVGMILVLIFAEALGLYGLIVGLIFTTKASA